MWDPSHKAAIVVSPTRHIDNVRTISSAVRPARRCSADTQGRVPVISTGGPWQWTSKGFQRLDKEEQYVSNDDVIVYTDKPGDRDHGITQS